MKERLLFVRNLNCSQFSSCDQLAYERLKRKIAARKSAHNFVISRARINCGQGLGTIFNYWNNAKAGLNPLAKNPQVILSHKRHVDPEDEEMIRGYSRQHRSNSAKRAAGRLIVGHKR